MSTWNTPLDQMLDRINRVARVAATCPEGDGEWILLRSDQMTDQLLFHTLSFEWVGLTRPANAAHFALILCRTGKTAGVWLHHLSTAALQEEFLPGCHDMLMWDTAS